MTLAGPAPVLAMTLLPPLRTSARAHLLGPACFTRFTTPPDSVYRMAFNGLFLRLVPVTATPPDPDDGGIA